MAQTRSTTKSKSKTSAQTSSAAHLLQIPRTGLFTFLAAFAGVVAAVPLTVAVMMPVMHQELASAVSQANKHVVSVTPADDLLSCSQPATSGSGVGGLGGGAGSGQVLGSSTVSSPAGGQGGQGGQGGGGSQTFITKMIGGGLTSNASIGGTIGAGANVSINTNQTETNTVKNDTDIHVSSYNDQDVSSGDATSKYNTSSGGGTTTSTGDATANNSMNVDFNVKNN